MDTDTDMTYMRPSATSVYGLKLLVYEPYAPSVYEALRY
jgi:hypothetical protein